MSDGKCRQEECPAWTGDGRVCACVLVGLEPGDLKHDDLDLGIVHDKTLDWG